MDPTTVPVPEGYVKLISNDGYEFLIRIECAMVSKFLKTSLESGFVESKTRIIPFPEISGKLLEKVCEYFYYKVQTQAQENNTIEFEVPQEMAVELLMCSHFLDC